MKALATNLSQTLRKWNLQIFAIAVVLGMAVCSSSARAQSGAGSIQGTVSDPNWRRHTRRIDPRSQPGNFGSRRYKIQ